ncbi:hypothetical protein J4456_00145 [Candidatus Pacearchaeota archaeon]|nr:hypothetical protein [Candidatus Pacearchaeota archaeon]
MTLNSEKILEFSRRREVYNMVNRFAGCHFRELERKSTIPGSSLKYHLDYLSRHKIIAEVKEGNFLRYYPFSFPIENRRILNLLRQQSIRHILLLFTTQQSCTPDELVRFTSLSPSIISWHVKKLERQKIISMEKNGREKTFHLIIDRKSLTHLLLSYKESFFDTLVNNSIDLWDI